MKTVMVGAISTLFLVGCASMNAKDKEQASTVKVTDLSFLNTPHECAKIGSVSGSSFGDVGGQSAAIAHMKLAAAKAGANVVASNLQFTRQMGLMTAAEGVNGIALNCPGTAFAKITSIDEVANY